MHRFDRFSVREDTAVNLCKNLFGVNATWVLDPVFIAPTNIYLNLIAHCKQQPPDKPYVFAYVLDPTEEKERILKNIAQQGKLQIRAISDIGHSREKVLQRWNIETLFDVKIESWLAHIYHCSFFVTDSFHGMCFAIMFHKQFLVLVNKRRGETRFTSLLNLLGLEARLCYSEQELRTKARTLSTIDYTEVDKKLNQERERSRKWLRDAIEVGKDVKKPFDTFDILDGRCDDLEREIQKLQQIIEKQKASSFRMQIKKSWLFRKIRGGYRCVKENGWKYTIRHFGEKVKGKFHH